jgi:hypothetical protein
VNQKLSAATTLARLGRRSQWFIAELIVIIAGVLIALAIDEWRGNIEEAALEKAYLTQLIADLKSTEAQVIDAKTGNAPFEQAANDLLAAFESSNRPGLDEVRRILTEMPKFDGPVPQLATIESMVSAGDMRLVRDSNVRAEITRYLTFARDYWMTPLAQREEDHRALYISILAVAQSYGISPSYRQGHVKTRSGSSNEPDIDAFFDDSEAYLHVSMFLQNRQIVASFYQARLGTQAEQLREVLETYLSTL